MGDYNSTRTGAEITAAATTGATSSGNTIQTGYATFLGGVHVGGASDPVDDNLIVDGSSTLTAGVILGVETVASSTVSPIIPVTFITIDGTVGYALADGTTAGTIKHISVKTVANTPVGTLTPNATAGAWATAAFSVVGQSLTLLWDGAGWAIIGRQSGAAQLTGAVGGLPVIAE